MITFIRLIAVYLVVLSFHAAAKDVDLLWVEIGQPNHIMHSRYANDEWTKAEIIYSNNHPITSIGFVKDLNGVEILVWSEQIKTRSVIMKMQRSSGQMLWSQAKLFINFGKENLASTMVIDRANQIWLFFSSNQGDLDDVYLSKRSELGWSSPIKVNNNNKVPDIQPHAKLDKNGNVLISWRSYDFEVGDYLLKEIVFELDKSLKSSYKTDPVIPEQSLSNLVMPSFLPSNTAAMVYFSKNRLQQSVIITPLDR